MVNAARLPWIIHAGALIAPRRHLGISRMLMLAALLAAALLASSCEPFGPGPIQSAVLGGPKSAWDAQFGTGQFVMEFGYYYYPKLQGENVSLEVYFDSGIDGQRRAVTIAIYPDPIGNGVVWGTATSTGIYESLIPPDAIRVQDTEGLDGLAHVRRSTDLAASFKPSMFPDSTGNRSPPGTFVVQCSHAGSGFDGCLVNFGSLFR